MATPLVELRDIHIAFGGIKAVDGVTVDLYPGEVVGLLGHNGAGKSTLIKCLSGAYKADSGEILINGERVAINNPRDARAHNIETIYQTLALADNLDAASNLFLGRELLTPLGFVDDPGWRPRRGRSWRGSTRTSASSRTRYPPCPGASGSPSPSRGPSTSTPAS